MISRFIKFHFFFQFLNQSSNGSFVSQKTLIGCVFFSRMGLLSLVVLVRFFDELRKLN